MNVLPGKSVSAKDLENDVNQPSTSGTATRKSRGRPSKPKPPSRQLPKRKCIAKSHYNNDDEDDTDDSVSQSESDACSINSDWNDSQYACIIFLMY